MYNPLIHKTPYGASAAGKETRIVFPLDVNLNVERVFIVLRKEGRENTLRYELPYKSTEGREKIFEGAFALNDFGIWKYRFEGELDNGDIAFFGRGYDGTALRGDWLQEWQLTVTKYEYKTPDWAKRGVVYHLFADRFRKAGNRPFQKKGKMHLNWNELPDVEREGEEYRADDFFGGDVEGIIAELEYLKELGVTCVYLSPVFESSSNHRYDTGDYLKIDSLFGEEASFKTLIEEGKKKGINIVLDGVFNHTGADSVYFNKFGNYPSVGAYQSKDSPYYGWYTFTEFPDGYDCWWGSKVVPCVNKSAAGWRELVLGKNGVIEKWSKLGVKGWRLDVVDELPVDFTFDLCAKIKTCDEDALIVGEVWEDASVKVSYGEWRPYFMGGQLDSVMNYPFKEAILDFVISGDKYAFISVVSSILEHYPKQSLDTLFNLIDSHDTVRALTRLGEAETPLSKAERQAYKLTDKEYALAKSRLIAASILQYTLPGVPCLYYGDEAGTQGFEDPMNRAPYPWGREDAELLAHYKSLGVMRAEYSEILKGETVFVPDEELLIYTRRSDMQQNESADEEVSAIVGGGKIKKNVLMVFANPADRVISREISGTDAISGEKTETLVLKPNEVKALIF